MNTTLKYEKRMLLLVYLLCLALFTNIAVKQTPIDKMAFIIAGILIIIIGFSHFIIRKFYPDGDKYMLIFASVLAVVGIAILYSNETVSLVYFRNSGLYGNSHSTTRS